MALAARAELKAPHLAELAALDDTAFRALFRKSPVKRIGRDRFLRNVMIAIGNSGDSSLEDSAWAGLEDKSALVRGAAVWALSRLLPAEIFQALAQSRAVTEPDPDVRREWQAMEFPAPDGG
jgi:epoxyqueuosine reductase